jgi:polysaccharide deacetylase family protein (PEP-CTERM system associated)
LKNILTIDVEEIFHAEYVKNAETCNFPHRTPHNISVVLKLLRDQGANATFFVVGEIAERFPDLIRIVPEEDHEVGFHGWSHLPLGQLSPSSLRQEIREFKRIYPRCIGYRAPSFSLNNRTSWMLETLQEQNFRYDSSVFPAWTPLYGVYNAPLKPYVPSRNNFTEEGKENCGILEFPLTVADFFGLRFPIAGGFWLRLWNLDLIVKAIRKLNRRGIPAVMYVHSWEFDSRRPRARLGPYKSFVTYFNIAKVVKRFERILDEFEFTSFADYIKSSELRHLLG